MTCLPTAICTPGDSRSTRRSAGSFDWFASTAKVHPSATSIAHSDIFPQSFSSVCLHQGRAAQYGRKAKHRVILSENKVKKQSDADKSAVCTRFSKPPVAFSTDYRLNHYSHKQRKALDPHTHPPIYFSRASLSVPWSRSGQPWKDGERIYFCPQKQERVHDMWNFPFVLQMHWIWVLWHFLLL